MRRAIGLFGIIAVVMGLWTGPFFHIHEVDDPDTHDHLATLHSHFFETFQARDSSETRIEDAVPHAHGVDVTVIVGSGRKVQPIVAEIQTANIVFETSTLSGFGADVSVRAHDPPDRRNSSPRSPPL
ncbi:MAG TPA: hypothetical protein VFO86_11195 [Terriglobia bacterium]|nr:hypothetical protein [Terriglobia bacterium]